jgi:antitoxin HigA-1
MAMFNPPHPGEIIREDCLKPLDMSVTAAAEWLGVSRQSLSELLNGRSGVSANMAIRLEKAGWSTAETWVGAQAAHDLWQAKQHADSIKVARLPSLAVEVRRMLAGESDGKSKRSPQITRRNVDERLRD